MTESTATLQARLASLRTRRDEVLEQRNVKSAELDGQRTEFFAPNLKQLEAEIAKLEQKLGDACLTTRRRAIGVYF